MSLRDLLLEKLSALHDQVSPNEDDLQSWLEERHLDPNMTPDMVYGYLLGMAEGLDVTILDLLDQAGVSLGARLAMPKRRESAHRRQLRMDTGPESFALTHPSMPSRPERPERARPVSESQTGLDIDRRPRFPSHAPRRR